MTRQFLIILSIITAAILLLPNLSWALTVGPAKMEFSTDPGDTISGELFLMNEAGQAQTFYPIFEKFIEVDGEKKFLRGEPTELTNWFRMPKNVTLGPQEQKQIPFTINLPKNAPPGGHFAVIWWSTAPPKSGQPVAIVTRVGILVYLRISGDIKEEAKVLSFTTAEGKRFFSWLPEKFTIIFENTGNVYLKPAGEITIKNIFGITKALFSVNRDGLQILPQSKKDLRVFGESAKWRGFGFGLYTAELNLKYGEGQKQIQDKFRFVAITWQIILPAILILLILIFGITKGIKKYNQWIIKKAQESRS